MELEELEQLLRKYNAGIASPEEESLLKKWYEQVEGRSHAFSDPDNRNAVKLRIESQLNTHINQHHDASTTRTEQSIDHSNNGAEESFPLKERRPAKNASFKTALLKYLVAASVIGVIVIGGIKWFAEPARHSVERTLISTSNTRQPLALKTIENKTNVELTASLSDGSRVTIYPGSTLRYLPEFEKEKRTLYLNGKAFFKVSKDTSRPLTVYAAGIATTALGTVFIVSELADQNVSIALIEGSIKVAPENAASNEFVILKPGDKVVANSNKFNSYTLERKVKKNTSTVPGDTTVNTSDEADAMVFKNASLEVVFKKISEKFDITIHYEEAPGIEKALFTGKFLEDDSLEFICTTICNLHGYRYRKDENILTIFKQ